MRKGNGVGGMREMEIRGEERDGGGEKRWIERGRERVERELRCVLTLLDEHRQLHS